MPAKSSSFASSSKQPRRRSRSASAAAQRDNGASSSRGGNRKAASQGAAGSSRNTKLRQEAIQVDSDDSDDDEEDADAGEYVIEAIVDHGCDPDRGDLVQVRWEGYGSDEDTWEPETKIRESANDIVNTYFANLPNARQKEKKEAEKRKQLYEKMERDRAKRERDKARASSNDEGVSAKKAGKQQGSQGRRQGKLDGYVKSAGASVTGGGSSSRASKRKKAIESEEEEEEVDELEEEEEVAPPEPKMNKREEQLRRRLDDLETWENEDLKVFTLAPLRDVPDFHILFPSSTETQAVAWIRFARHAQAILYPVEELRRKAPEKLMDFLLAHLNFDAKTGRSAER